MWPGYEAMYVATLYPGRLGGEKKGENMAWVRGYVCSNLVPRPPGWREKKERMWPGYEAMYVVTSYPGPTQISEPRSQVPPRFPSECRESLKTWLHPLWPVQSSTSDALSIIGFANMP